MAIFVTLALSFPSKNKKVCFAMNYIFSRADCRIPLITDVKVKTTAFANPNALNFKSM